MSEQQVAEQALAINKKGVIIQCITHNVLDNIPILSDDNSIFFINSANLILQMYYFFKKSQHDCVFYIYICNMGFKNDNIIDYSLILSKHGVNKTKFRVTLLNLFYKIGGSLTVEDIMRSTFNLFNKATIYRALECFEKKGLIHKVPDINNLIRYSLCSNNECGTNFHSHSHGHFICNRCDQTYCLENSDSLKSRYLNGFYIKKQILILEGYCDNCYTN